MHVIPDNDNETVKNSEYTVNDYMDMAPNGVFGN